MAFDQSAPWQVTRVAQRALGLPVTGVWDSKTQRAYEGGSPSVRAQIDRVMVRENLSPYSVQRVTTQVSEPSPVRRSSAVSKPAAGAKVESRAKPRSFKIQTRKVSPIMVNEQAVKPLPTSSEFISYNDGMALAHQYERVYNLPSGTLTNKLPIEAPRVRGGFNPSGKGGYKGLYRGLYQFDPAGDAWAVAANTARRFGQNLGPFASNWYSADRNTSAAGAYAAHNANELRKSGIPITVETLYAAHQQGAAGFAKMVKKGRSLKGEQSGKSKGVIAVALSQARAASAQA